MSLGQFNQRHEVEVTAYNESEPTRQSGGIITKTKGADITLRVLLMHIPNKRSIVKKNGQEFIEDGYILQVSSAELTDKSFEIYVGRTFIEKDDNTYSISEVKDYRDYKLTQCLQARAVRLIPIDAN